MNAQKGFRTLALLLCLSIAASAQKNDDPVYYKWAPSDIINLHDSVAVYKTVSKINDLLPDMTLAVIDKTGAEKGPEVLLPENTLGMAMLNGNLLAIYQPHKSSENRDLHALLIDLVHRSTIKDKVIYSEPSDYNTDFIMERDPNGNFQAILARVTGYKSKRQVVMIEGVKDQMKYDMTTALKVITLTPNLDATETPLNSVLTTGTYLTSAINSSGELFMVSNGGGSIVAEKFSHSGQLEGKLSETFLPRERTEIHILGHLDASTGNAMIIASKYEREDKKRVETAMRFDFDASKVYTAREDVLDKDYYRSILADQSQGTKIKSSNVKNIEALVPVSVVETKDYIAVCKEIQYIVVTGSGSSYVTHYWCDAAIISIYDHQMNLLRSVTVDKDIESFIENYPGINIHLDGDKLYAVTAELAGVAAYAEFAYSIDLKTGSLDKKRLKKGAFHGAKVTRPLYTFWLKNGFVMNYMRSRGLGGHKVETFFDAAEYE